MRVLVVEDEAVLAHTIARGLRREGMAVDLAFEGSDAVEKLAIHDYEVCVLDRDLPGIGGDEICRRLAADQASTRVLMLTAAGSLADRVEGLSLGADDYLPKPFAFAELVARIQALERRPPHRVGPVLTAGDLVVDTARRLVVRGRDTLQLTAKEFGVLETLLAAEGRVVSAEQLLERVWDEHADPFTNTVRVTVMTLRRKLGEPALIETVISAGYRI